MIRIPHFPAFFCLLLCCLPAQAAELLPQRGHIAFFDFDYKMPAGWSLMQTQSPATVVLKNDTDATLSCRFNVDVTDPTAPENAQPLTGRVLLDHRFGHEPHTPVLIHEEAGKVGAYDGIRSEYSLGYGVASAIKIYNISGGVRFKTAEPTVIKPEYRYFYDFSFHCQAGSDNKAAAQQTFNTVINSLHLSVDDALFTKVP